MDLTPEHGHCPQPPARGADQAIQTLMGRDVAPRFEFIMGRAPKVEEVDV